MTKSSSHRNARLAAKIHTMRFTTWRSLKCPSSCASTASTSGGVSRESSVSKNTMRLELPKPVKYALPWLLRREPSMTISPFTLKPQRVSSFSTRSRRSGSCIGENG